MQRAGLKYLPLRHSRLPLQIRTYPKPFLLCLRHESTRPAATTPPTAQSPNEEPIPPSDSLTKSPQRFEKVFSKTPKFLRSWIQPIANKPLSHITAFLILHELTAVVPLLGLTYIFHKAQWTPPVLPGEWMVQGVEKGAKLIRHYGLNVKGDNFVRLAFEFAAAYATVKVLLPVRLALSVWGTPWFARVAVLPFLGLFKRKKKSVKGSQEAAVTSTPEIKHEKLGD